MQTFAESCRTVLESFFSEPIAKAIVGSASKVASTHSASLDAAWLQAFRAELRRLLDLYLPDPGRRAEAEERLLALERVAPSDPASSTKPPRSQGAASTNPPTAQLAVSVDASTRVLIRDQRDVPNACEVALDLSRKLGFSLVERTKVATAVSELARNMLQYAGGGTIRFTEVQSPRRGLEAFFEDHGPGIHDVEHVLESPDMGIGLRGSKGIADEFRIDTQPGDGTRITMRKYVA